MRNKKKYGIAALAAVAVLAMSAFAASLNVDGGTLQAGVDSDLTCADDANLSYETGYPKDLGEELFGVISVTVKFTGNANCDGSSATIKVNNSDGDATSPHGFAVGEVVDQEFTATVGAGKTLTVEDLDQVQILVKKPSNSTELGGYTSGVFADAA